MARNSCWNKISDNTSYIVSEIKNDVQNRTERKKTNDKIGSDFAIFYQTEKKGQIDFWNIKDIGL